MHKDTDIDIYKGRVWLSARSPRYGIMHDVYAETITSQEDLEDILAVFYQDLLDFADAKIEVFAKIFRRVKGGGVIKWQVCYDGASCHVERYDYDRRLA